MGNESKNYIYYTVIDISVWRRGNEHILGEGNLTCEKVFDFIDLKFKVSNDFTCNFRVNSAEYCDDINYWIENKLRDRRLPVFVQFQNNQPVKLTGEGQLFKLYEVDNDGNDLYTNTNPDNSSLGLALNSGRL